MRRILEVSSHAHDQLIDITDKVRPIVQQSGLRSGICHLYTPHTTCSVVINENADPSVAQDILEELGRLVPWQGSYKHTEGNSAAHIKSVLVGPAKVVLVDRGELVLGTWQGIFLAEFDGPRSRQVWLEFVPGTS